MNYRDQNCFACGQTTSGDCGIHGPVVIADNALSDAIRERDQPRAEVERLKGPTTCQHNPAYHGGACGTCHADALLQIRDLRRWLEEIGKGKVGTYHIESILDGTADKGLIQ